MTEKLTETEARIVGALIEKQLTTPEYYPLTLNALVAACNQKTNREPVVSYSEQIVQKSLDDLREKNIVYVFYGSTSRVPKYKHILDKVYELEPPEIAVLCVLMLRGAQTLGELRERTGRLYEFSGLGETSETLDGLMRRDEPLVVKLERQPGQKEVRYAHLLSGKVVVTYQPQEKSVSSNQAENERIAILEGELENLRNDFNLFRQSFEDFKKQFE
ncbi:MAG TPA: YceH family protein [Pyrinomonadaceae bacterium]|nr:YceH family protein [Pyrinomonadaceae bacterium]